MYPVLVSLIVSHHHSIADTILSNPSRGENEYELGTRISFSHSFDDRARSGGIRIPAPGRQSTIDDPSTDLSNLDKDGPTVAFVTPTSTEKDSILPRPGI